MSAKKILPDSKVDDVFTESRIFPGTEHEYTVCLPAACAGYDGELGLLIAFDQGNYSQVMEQAIAEGIMPPSLGVFVGSGARPAKRPDAFARSNRSQEYDGLGPDVPDFLIRELIPHVCRTYGVKISANPDYHMACGCSSGGIAAWNCAWERNEYFHRALIFSPTLCAFRGGDFYPAAVRKYEPKKIRCYMVTGTCDMENSAGCWYLEDLRMEAALRYAGYDYHCEVVQAGVHGCNSRDEYKLKGLRFCWNNWKTEPVRRAQTYPPRIADMISPDTEWTSFSGPVPEKQKVRIPEGTYIFSRNTISFCRNDGTIFAAATGFGNISALAVSPDHARLYIGDRCRRFIYSMSIGPDGSLTDLGKFGHLDVADDFTEPGAWDLAVDSQDRVYAATEIGIQTFSSQSEHNCILPLPEKRGVRNLFLSPDETNPCMTVLCDDGTLFRRPWKQHSVSGDNAPIEPSTRAF